MPWRIDLPNGESVRTDELVHGKVVDIAKRHNTSWSIVLEAPTAGTGELMADMFEQFCAERGCPTKTSAMTTTELASKFVPVPSPPKEGDAGDGDEGDGADPSTVDAPAKS